jgi:hypothetical protein
VVYAAERDRKMLLDLISTFNPEPEYRRIRKMIHKGTGRWALEHPDFKKWFQGTQSSCIWFSGIRM